MNHSRRQVGLGGAESPGAWPDEDRGPESAERIDGDRDGVRAEQAASVVVRRWWASNAAATRGIEWIRRVQVDATDDGQGQQDGTPGAGTDGDKPGQLLARQQVQHVPRR